MSCLESKICYRFLLRLAFVFCPDFVDISPFLCCSQLICFLFVLYSYFAIQVFFSVSACNGISFVCNVVPFLASLSAILLPSSPTWEGTLCNMTIVMKAWTWPVLCHLLSLIVADYWKKLPEKLLLSPLESPLFQMLEVYIGTVVEPGG